MKRDYLLSRAVALQKLYVKKHVVHHIKQGSPTLFEPVVTCGIVTHISGRNHRMQSQPQNVRD